MKKILLLSLEDYSFVDEVYQDLLARLEAKAAVVKCTTDNVTIRMLEDNTFTSIFVYEPSVMRKKHKNLAKVIADWTKAGGTTVFGANCSSFIEPPVLNAFFSTYFDKRWQSGAYVRKTFWANESALLGPGRSHVPSISMKALHLKNVARRDCVFFEGNDVFGPVETGEAPVVYAAYGSGEVGWIGDVNNEEDHIPVVLAMLRV